MEFEFQKKKHTRHRYDLRWYWCGCAAPPHATVLLALLAVAFCIKICLAVSGHSLKNGLNRWDLNFKNVIFEISDIGLV